MLRVEPSLFPVTLSLMKVAKSPGGQRSTVCLCLRERIPEVHGGAGKGGKTSGGPPDREGELGSAVKIEVLMQLRPPTDSRRLQIDVSYVRVYQLYCSLRRL